MREAYNLIIEHPWVSLFIAIFIWGCIALMFQRDSEDDKKSTGGGFEGM